MDTPSVPQLVLYALAMTLGIGLVVAASTTGAAFGAYNIEWDGTSDFRELADTHAESQVTVETDAYETLYAPNAAPVVLAATTSPIPSVTASAYNTNCGTGGDCILQ